MVSLQSFILWFLGLLLQFLLLLLCCFFISFFILPFSFNLSSLVLLSLWHHSLGHLMNIPLGRLSIPWWRNCFTNISVLELYPLFERSKVLSSILKNVLWLVTEDLPCKIVE